MGFPIVLANCDVAVVENVVLPLAVATACVAELDATAQLDTVDTEAPFGARSARCVIQEVGRRTSKWRKVLQPCL